VHRAVWGQLLRSARIATTAAATVCKRGTAMRRLTMAVASTTAAAAGTLLSSHGIGVFEFTQKLRVVLGSSSSVRSMCYTMHKPYFLLFLLEYT
jgi:hypothetical protein